METHLERIFLSPHAKLRMFWRAVLFYCVGTFVLFPLLGWPIGFLAKLFHPAEGLSAGAVALAELRNLTNAIICTGAFAVYERRRIDSYGLPIARAFAWQTWEGTLAGVVLAGTVALGMIALGGMQVHGLSLHGRELALSALAWFATNILVGLAEESWFRGYLQFSLWRSIGFWPASIVLALIFAAEHYFFKAGENLWDVITLVSLSLIMSYSIIRTGTLWFAVGFHFAFDYMQLFVIGTPNAERVPIGRMFNVTFNGPAWLTGGVLGTEASFLMYPAIALLGLYVWWRYRENPPAQFVLLARSRSAASDAP